jgi:16S rRNA (guanine1207-N2)-methyltransferase/23S rRNA (guanine1835-N2)-methyltransferase
MKVNFEVLSHKLVLKRYPQKAQKQNLQAWDAADEYLVEHLEQTEELFEGVRLLIINDQFGALACCLYQYSPHWHSDSMVATLGMKENMADNGLEIRDHQVSAQTQNIPAEFDLVLIKLPKSHSYLAHLLATIKPMLSAKGKVIAAGKVPQVQKNVLTLFEKYIGSTKTSLAKKKSRLIFSTPNDNKTLCAPPALNWKLEPHEYIITNNANVFSRQKLDIGARFMLDHLPNCKNKQVIDLGCGNGVLGLLALAEQQAETVAFVDDSALAIDSAKATIEQNLPEQLHSVTLFKVIVWNSAHH